MHEKTGKNGQGFFNANDNPIEKDNLLQIKKKISIHIN
jgi:hypothetical protein